MEIYIREYSKKDCKALCEIWNEVVKEGVAFPQEELLNEASGDKFFKEQTFTGAAVNKLTEEVVGLYILHPNNIGRCGHICNASYAVKKYIRGEHIGKKLVLHCIDTARKKGFIVLQFNAVVATNVYALKLYKSLGFKQLGVIPKGFRMPNGTYESIIPHYYLLEE